MNRPVVELIPLARLGMIVRIFEGVLYAIGSIAKFVDVVAKVMRVSSNYCERAV